MPGLAGRISTFLKAKITSLLGRAEIAAAKPSAGGTA